jgi:RNA polymerase sigma factor (sigma-70 family)
VVEGRPLDGESGPPGSREETELIARARRGDAAAYTTLVEEYQTIAFRTAYMITGSAADAEEAAQEAFLKAHAALPRFRAEAPFRPWLLTIVANEARNRRRSARRRAELTLRAAEEPHSGGAAPSPEAALLASEQRRTLLAAVNDLSDDERLVITCRYFLDLSEEETAAVIGRPKGTVKSRSSRALARLRDRMEEEAVEEKAR